MESMRIPLLRRLEIPRRNRDVNRGAFQDVEERRTVGCSECIEGLVWEVKDGRDVN